MGYFTDRWGSLYRSFEVLPGKPYSRLVGGARLEQKLGSNGWAALSWSHGKDLPQSLPEAFLVCEDTSTLIRAVRPIFPGCQSGEQELVGSRRPSL